MQGKVDPAGLVARALPLARASIAALATRVLLALVILATRAVLNHRDSVLRLLLVHLPDDFVQASLCTRAEATRTNAIRLLRVRLACRRHIARQLHGLGHVEFKASLPNLLAHVL